MNWTLLAQFAIAIGLSFAWGWRLGVMVYVFNHACEHNLYEGRGKPWG